MQPTRAPASRWSHRSRKIAIALVATLVVIAFVAVEFRFTNVDITVISDHTTATVTFTFTFDGRQVGSGVLAPGQKTLYRVPLAWWSYACQPHSFSAASTGGESGPSVDLGNLTVCAGTSYGTWLSV